MQAQGLAAKVVKKNDAWEENATFHQRLEHMSALVRLVDAPTCLPHPALSRWGLGWGRRVQQCRPEPPVW